MGTVFVGITIGVLVVIVICKLIRDKKNKKGCCRDCSQCGGDCPH